MTGLSQTHQAPALYFGDRASPCIQADLELTAILLLSSPRVLKFQAYKIMTVTCSVQNTLFGTFAFHVGKVELLQKS